jgi:hypothetical protein
MEIGTLRQFCPPSVIEMAFALDAAIKGEPTQDVTASPLIREALEGIRTHVARLDSHPTSARASETMVPLAWLRALSQNGSDSEPPQSSPSQPPSEDREALEIATSGLKAIVEALKGKTHKMHLMGIATDYLRANT